MADSAETVARKHPPLAAALLVLVLGLFVGGGLFSGWIFLSTVRELLAGNAPPSPRELITPREVTVSIPGITTIRSAAVATVVAAPAKASPTPFPEEAAPVWDGKDRVTILLLGIDEREDEKGLPTRSDTMILVTMDPLNMTGGMLSLPRDLWVPIPGHGSQKLNTAHFFGELDKAGSGPAASRRAVQYNIGVPINYTARVNFKGFERLVDAIGGLTIDVERAILDNEYPNEKYGINRLFIAPGPQRMNGITALRYARSRHADSDFGRIRRQQRVLQSAREEALQLGIIPKLPTMIGIINASIVTDIPFTDLWALANVGRQIQSGQITSRHVDDSMVIDANMDGSVLLPDRDKIRRVVQELFYDPAVRKDAARIEVLNGTSRDGLASGLRATLLTQSFNVVRADGADRTDYRETVIVNRGKSATAQRLAQLLNVPARNIRSENAPGPGQADVSVILGADHRPI